MSKTTHRSESPRLGFGSGDGVRAAIEDAGLTCAEFQVLALEDIDTDAENFHAIVDTWRALQEL